MPPPKKAKLSSVTRFVVVPLLLLAVGIRLGMSLGPGQAPSTGSAPARGGAAQRRPRRG